MSMQFLWKSAGFILVSGGLASMLATGVNAAETLEETPGRTDAAISENLTQEGAAGVNSARTDDEPEELATVVVTAGRMERLQEEVPLRTEVVSGDEIRKTHARSLKEALENVPGLQLREVHGKSGYEVTMQGMTSDQVVVLIDGLPLAASTGSTTDVSQLAMVDVDHVEIVKGAASAEYGSSAMGGVINVITRKSGNATHASLTYDLGTYGSQNSSGKSSDIAQNHVNAQLEGGSGEFSGRLSADVRDSKGFDADDDNWVREGDDSKRRQLDAQLSWRPGERNYITLGVQHFTEDDVQWLTPEIVDRYPNKYEDIERDRFTLAAGWEFDQALLTVKALSEDYQSESSKQNLGFSATYDNRDMELWTRFLSLQLDIPAGGAHNLQLGVESRHEDLYQELDGVPEVDADRQNYEVFVQDDYFFSAKGELVAGVRVQDDSDFGSYTSPKIALRYDLIESSDYEMVLRSSVGTGYRVPNLKERFYTFDHSSLGYMVLGNEDLDPESSISYQAGISLRAGNTLLDINAFYNDVKNLIQTDEDNYSVVNGIAIYTYKNIDNALTYGLETSLTQPVGEALNLRLAHTYTHAENTDTNEALTNRPEHVARAGIDWQVTSAVSTSARVRYQSRELSDTETDTWSPAWTTVDLKLNYQPRTWLTLFGGVDNLTNRQRDFTSGTDFGPIAGRFIYLGTTLNY